MRIRNGNNIKSAVKFWTYKSRAFCKWKKDEKIIKELVNEPQIAKSVYVLKTDRNLSDIFKKRRRIVDLIRRIFVKKNWK